MIRLRSVVVVAALVAGLSACKSELATCSRMNNLCGTSEDSCRQLLKDTRETFGDEGVNALKTCFADATSCSSATGCVAGVGLKGLANSAGEFLQGMKKGMESR